MAPKKSKKNKSKKGKSTGDSSSSSSASPFSLEVSDTPLPQLLPGGPYQTNPEQLDGPRNAFEAKTVEEGFYVRVDMPGVGKDSVEVNFEDNKKLTFSGKAPIIAPYDSGPRNYHGVITFTTSEHLEVSHVKIDMNNGVLRVVLVGSGFPPHFYVGSAHFKKRSRSDHFELLEGLTDDILMVSFGKFTLSELPVNYVGVYPFQVDGAKGTYELLEINDDYIFYRLDMPDVGTEGLTFRMRDGGIIYGGTGKKASEYDESKRLYMGIFELQCLCACKVVEVRGDIIDGVMRLLIKKERPQATERIGNTGCSEAGSCS